MLIINFSNGELNIQTFEKNNQLERDIIKLVRPVNRNLSNLKLDLLLSDNKMALTNFISNNNNRKAFAIAFLDLSICEKLDSLKIPYIFFSTLLTPILLENLITILKSRFSLSDANCILVRQFLRNFCIIPNNIDANNDKKDAINIYMATYPARKSLVKNTLQSLFMQRRMPSTIHLFANGYSYALMSDLLTTIDKKVNFVYIIDTLATLRAAGKFFWLSCNDDLNDKNNDIHFVCDDDIIYPKNYIVHGISFISISDDKKRKIYSCLGAIFPTTIKVFPFKKYIKKHIRFHERNDTLLKVHQIGTGVMFFKGKFPNFKHFLTNVAYNDITLAILARTQNIELYTIPKKANWLKSVDQSEGLFQEKLADPNRGKDFIATLISLNPWK